MLRIIKVDASLITTKELVVKDIEDTEPVK